jgi:hypothetical protein
MATPFPFGSGNVLTAAQLNAITTLPVSTKTTSYVLTVADLGTRIVMNSASATTITVNTSIFGASDVVEILNIGAGVCTVTAGTCTVGTSGTLALAQNAGGTLTFISASASVFTASGVTATAGGLTLVKTQTIGSAVSSVTVSDAFSSTYENYRIIVIANSASGNNDMAITLGSTSTGYYAGSNYVSYAGGASSATNNNAASWSFIGAIFTFAAFADFDLFQPNLASETFLTFRQLSATYAGAGGGYLNNSTAYTAFTITPNASNTLTGGTIYVYGYAKA